MLGLQCGKLQNTLWDFAAAKQKQRSCFHPFFPPFFSYEKKGGKKRKKIEQNEQSVPWSFKRMCTKKCEQENMAKGREKNFFLLSRKAVHLCIYAQSAFVEKKEALRSIFFSSKKKGPKKKGSAWMRIFSIFFLRMRIYALLRAKRIRRKKCALLRMRFARKSA